MPVTAWLPRIAANVIHGQARRERREPQVVSTSSCSVWWDGSMRVSPCDWTERVERQGWIQRLTHVMAL